MTLELIDPPDLPTPLTYSHVVVATGSALVFVTGQEPEDERAGSQDRETWRSPRLSPGEAGSS
jgi:enamine deaminase RidA (YjgF/YER057c/UK114 family)